MRETSAWVGEGLITTNQRTLLLARHPLRSGGAHRFLAILAGIGGTLLVVGVSLIIKSNWEAIGDWVKISGLVALLAGAYGLGWRLKIAPGNFPKSGEACLAVGAMFFLLGIALVSQIFHIDSRPPNGVLLWWVGIVALPWLTRSKLMQLVSVLAGTTWFATELSARDSWLRLLENQVRWDGRSEFQLMAGAVFLVGVTLTLFGFGLRRGRHEQFAALHEKLGLILSCWSLYVLGFSWSAHNIFVQPALAARTEPVVVLMLLAALVAVWVWWRNRTALTSLAWYLALGFVPAIATLFGIELHDASWLWGGFACLALFLVNLGMIRIGLASGRESWINLGMAGMALNIITRYFLLFGTMLEGGVFFIMTGLLVLGLGYYLEHKRRALVDSARQEVAP